MATNETQPKDSAAQSPVINPIRRWVIGSNVLVQILMFAAIIGMVNYFSSRHFFRGDYSRNSKFSLAPLTKNALKQIKQSIKAIAVMPAGIPIAQDITQTLREYQTAAKGNFEPEFVDPFRNIQRTVELQEKYKFGDGEAVLILDDNGRTKFLNLNDMFETQPANPMSGQPPRVTGFKGEEVITSGLLELLEKKTPKLYFTKGHGELEMPVGGPQGFQPGAQGDKSMAAFIETVQRVNMSASSINLTDSDNVPDDAAALVIAGPLLDFTQREIQLMERYFNERQGRVIFTARHNARIPLLKDWLVQNGVTLGGDVALTMVKRMFNVGGEARAETSLQVETPTNITKEAGTIIKGFTNAQMPLSGFSQSLTVDRAALSAQRVKVTPLFETHAATWGETEFDSQNPNMRFDQDKDRKGPLTLGVALEKGGAEGTNVNPSRLVVLGNSTFFSDGAVRRGLPGDEIMSSIVNWIAGRGEFYDIPKKSKEAVRLNLSKTQLDRVAIAVLAVIPAFFGLIGIAVHFKRNA
jgi:hypothetical protein